MRVDPSSQCAQNTRLQSSWYVIVRDWWHEVRDADSIENIRWGKTCDGLNKLEFKIISGDDAEMLKTAGVGIE